MKSTTYSLHTHYLLTYITQDPWLRSEIDRINREVLRADGVGFVGSMPVSMSRRALQSVQRSDSYFVTEKSDGTRFLLYIVNVLAQY